MTVFRLTFCIAMMLAVGLQAATVTWNGGDMIWAQPDADSFSATYNSGDTPQFLGAGEGTITVASNVTPANMTFTGTYTIEGGTIAGSGSLSKNSGTLTLANTNTYTGNTTINSGTMIIQGASAMSTNTKVISKRNTTLSIRTDDAGPVDLGTEVEIQSIDTSSGVISQHGINVRNNGGATTGTTIILGKADFATGDMRAGRQFNVTGANGYILQFGDVDISPGIRGTATGGPNRFNPTSASIIIAGTVKALVGDTAASTTDNNLYLGGTMTGNVVSGTIANPDDYPGNPNAQPLNVYKGDLSEWTLSGINTYSGTTTVKQGILRITGSLNSTSVVAVSNNGGLIGYLAGTGTVGSVTLSGTGGIRLMDSMVATLSIDGDLDITGAADANDLYFDLGTAGNGTDKITVSGNVTMPTPGAGVINLNQLTGTKIDAGTYDLIDATGTMVSDTNFTLATTSAFGNNFALQLDGTSKILQVVVTSAAGAPPEAFWTGGGVDNNWSSLTNWATDVVGTNPLSVAPGYDTDVSFYATGAARLTTGTLDSDFDINSLTYISNALANTTIASAANTLILEASSGTGIVVNTAAGSPSHTISAPIALANSQTWMVKSNASLTASGVISDFDAGNSLTKAGEGELYFTALNNYVGATIVNKGTLKIWHQSLGNSTVPNALGMSSAAAENLLLGAGTTLEFVISGDNYRSTDRSFTINGTSNGASATLEISSSGNRGVNLASTASPAYGTPDQTRTLILTGTHTTGGNTYGFSHHVGANIADNGTGKVSVVKNGIGAWELTGNSSFSGGVTLNQGTLRISANNNCLGVGTLTMAGGTLIVDDDRSIPNGIQLDTDGRIFAAERTTPRTLTVGGAITGTGNLIVDGRGTVVLQGVGSTHSGDTVVSNGTLQLTFDDALPAFARLYLQTSSTTGLVDLAFTGKQQIGKLYFDGIQQPSGIYTNNGTTITGTGILSVGSMGTVLILK